MLKPIRRWLQHRSGRRIQRRVDQLAELVLVVIKERRAAPPAFSLMFSRAEHAGEDWNYPVHVYMQGYADGSLIEGEAVCDLYAGDLEDQARFLVSQLFGEEPAVFN